VTQSGLVVCYVAAAARQQGIRIIFIMRKPHHAYLVYDYFIVLQRGGGGPRCLGRNLAWRA
jgi:simple sugar transport system ATP-binding protein